MEPRVWGSAELVCQEEPEVWAALVGGSERAPGCPELLGSSYLQLW